MANLENCIFSHPAVIRQYYYLFLKLFFNTCFNLPLKTPPRLCSNLSLKADKCLMKCCDCRIDYLLTFWHFLSLFVLFPPRLLFADGLAEFSVSETSESQLKKISLPPFAESHCDHLSLSSRRPQRPQLPCGEPLLLVLAVISGLQRSQ